MIDAAAGCLNVIGRGHTDGMIDNIGFPAALADLPGETKQALVVTPADAAGCQAVAAAWDLAAGHWRQALPSMAATIGRNGWIAAMDKCEGDGCTPLGVYPLGPVFGSAASCRTAMPYRQATADDCWVDDPDSPQYNCWIRGVPNALSWERMLRDDGLYRYGIVVGYNTAPVVAGKGSAIFIHLGRGPEEPTAGCVALDEADLLRLLAWLEPQLSPVVVLGSGLIK